MYSVKYIHMSSSYIKKWLDRERLNKPLEKYSK